MSTVVNEPELETAAGRDDSPDPGVQTQVWDLLSALYPRNDLVERRYQHRYPYPYVVHLTPVAEDDVSPQGETVAVVGKHLSERGLGFYHPQPLPYRRMVASLETSSGSRLGFLIDLTWCRFTSRGWYESGGRFLQTVPPLTAR